MSETPEVRTYTDDEIAIIYPQVVAHWDRMVALFQKEGLSEEESVELVGYFDDVTASWAENIVERYRTADRATMEQTEPQSRALIHLARAGYFADLREWPPQAVVLTAFRMFMNPGNVLAGITVGNSYACGASDGRSYLVFSLLIDGEPQGEDGVDLAVTHDGDNKFRFNLMPFYVGKARMVQDVIDKHFDGDFETALKSFAAEMSFEVDWDGIWTLPATQ